MQLQCAAKRCKTLMSAFPLRLFRGTVSVFAYDTGLATSVFPQGEQCNFPLKKKIVIGTAVAAFFLFARIFRESVIIHSPSACFFCGFLKISCGG